MQYAEAQYAKMQGDQVRQMGKENTLAPKEPTLQGRAEELMNYISRLGANQSLMREKLFGEGQEKCVIGSQHDANGALESLLAMACQSAANLVGESEGILRRL